MCTEPEIQDCLTCENKYKMRYLPRFYDVSKIISKSILRRSKMVLKNPLSEIQGGSTN